MLAGGLPPPVVERHEGIDVVRDDLIPGGTKRRFLAELVAREREVVYASPAIGGAQLALAFAAREAGVRATIFVAERKRLHARTLGAMAAGARIVQVPFGYLVHVQARAAAYAAEAGARLMAFGGEGPEALAAIAEAAAAACAERGPWDEVWCAAGSGVLARGLQLGIGAERARFVAVRVGRALPELGPARVIASPLAYDAQCRRRPPFPSCPYYERKAWALCASRRRRGLRIMFWNVLGE